MFLLNRCLTLPLLIYGLSFMWTPHVQLEGVYYEIYYIIENIVISLYRFILCRMVYIIIYIYIYKRPYFSLCLSLSVREKKSNCHIRLSLIFYTKDYYIIFFN